MKITKIDRPVLREMRPRIDDALIALGKEYGVVFSVLKGKYTDNNVVFQLSASLISKDGSVLTPLADDFKRFAKNYGLQASDLGRDFTLRGVVYTLKGLNPRARTRPFIATRGDGKDYIFTAVDVRAALGVKTFSL